MNEFSTPWGVAYYVDKKDHVFIQYPVREDRDPRMIKYDKMLPKGYERDRTRKVEVEERFIFKRGLHIEFKIPIKK